jgi:heme exporter protein B
MAAIASRANQNAAIMVIMGFPVIIPQLMLLIRISKSAFGEVFREGALLQLIMLLGGLDILVIALCMILFPFLWKD